MKYKYKKFLSYLSLTVFCILIHVPCVYSFADIDRDTCSLNGKKLYGTVKVIEYGIPDFTVKKIEYGLPDLRVKKMDYGFPNSCGEWKFIQYGIPDFTIKFVEYGIADLNIKFIEYGLPGL